MRIARKIFWVLLITSPWWGIMLVALKSATGVRETIESSALLWFAMAPGLLILVASVTYRLGVADGEKNFVKKRIQERETHAASIRRLSLGGR